MDLLADLLAAMLPDGGQIAPEMREQIFTPFLVAVETARRELAATDASVRFAYQVQSRRLHGGVVALLELTSGVAGCLALARRVLRVTQVNVDNAENANRISRRPPCLCGPRIRVE